jgi:hypothetical protein
MLASWLRLVEYGYAYVGCCWIGFDYMAVLKIFIQHQSSTIIGPTTLLDNIAFGATIKRQRMLRVCIQ